MAGRRPYMLITLLYSLFALGACSSHNTTLAPRDAGGGQVIYRLSEEQAFTVVLDAYAEVLPKRRLYDITGVRRGYQSTYRFALDTYSQKVLVVPAIGTDPSGREVSGYSFDVSGSGTSGFGRSKNIELFRRLQTALDATGTATVVTNPREGLYETDGRAYRAGGKDAREAAPGLRPSGPKTADQLRDLKTMRDQGLITDQEYEAKRRQILDRM